VRLKSLKAGFGPLGGEFEIAPHERELLHPLFVVLRDKRALLYAPYGREDTPYVTESIKDIRQDLTTTLKELGPDAGATSRLETLRRACREYLDAAASHGGPGAQALDFGPALADLRTAFRTVAAEFADRYDLSAARELVEEIDRADEAAGHPPHQEP
jgi:hypothetical protein